MATVYLAAPRRSHRRLGRWLIVALLAGVVLQHPAPHLEIFSPVAKTWVSAGKQKGAMALSIGVINQSAVAHTFVNTGNVQTAAGGGNACAWALCVG